MGKWVKALARYEHNLSVYVATSAAPSAARVVMLQDIFDVIWELRDLANRFAAEGCSVHFPALCDRVEADKVLPCGDACGARTYKNQLRYEEINADIQAAMQETGYYFDETKRYIDKCVTLFETDRQNIFEGNARRVFSRMRCQ